MARGGFRSSTSDDHTATDLPFDLDVASATWRPNHDQLVVSTNDLAKTDEVVTRHFWVINADGSGTPRPIRVSQYAINEPSLSPDGTKLAYATWEPFVEGRIHVVDIDAGDDHSITTDAQDGYVWLNPQFSPDGTHILAQRFFQSTDRSQVALLPADGVGSATAMGPTTENPAANPFFSPDGTSILAEYPALKSTWLFDAHGMQRA